MQGNLFQKELDVLKLQRETLKVIGNRTSNINSELDDLEKQVMNLVKQSSLTNEQIKKHKEIVETEIKADELRLHSVRSRSFNELLEVAHQQGYVDIDIENVATKREIEETNMMLKTYYKEYTDKYKLDGWDYTIAGVIGTIATITDFFLVTQVNLKIGNVTPGKMKSGVEELWSKILPPDKIKFLEDRYKVPYDKSQTSQVSREVLGLCPKYHRLHSLGHDPLLGFIFGVMDILNKTMTSIDSSGRIVVQSVNFKWGDNAPKFNKPGEPNLIEAIIVQFGHLLSDVSTPSQSGKILSVPAPLTPLLQLIQCGSIEYQGKRLTVAELSRKMYYDGYNFNHFIGMSIPVLLIEVLTRLSYVIKEMFINKEIKISNISTKNNPKLEILLCISNGILFAENMGKLVVTKNPFAINYVSWIATAKYGFKTLKWVAYDREMGKMDYAQGYIDNSWKDLLNTINEREDNQEIYYIE